MLQAVQPLELPLYRIEPCNDQKSEASLNVAPMQAFLFGHLKAYDDNDKELDASIESVGGSSIDVANDYTYDWALASSMMPCGITSITMTS